MADNDPGNDLGFKFVKDRDGSPLARGWYSKPASGTLDDLEPTVAVAIVIPDKAIEIQVQFDNEVYLGITEADAEGGSSGANRRTLAADTPHNMSCTGLAKLWVALVAAGPSDVVFQATYDIAQNLKIADGGKTNTQLDED